MSLDLVTYDGGDVGTVDLNLDPLRDTMWASVEQMSKLFGRKPNTIIEHIQKVFREGELDEPSVTRKFRVTAKDGKSYNILHYDLDVIISVGYRVSSREATRFRQWATSVLRAYLTEGYALNERSRRCANTYGFGLEAPAAIPRQARELGNYTGRVSLKTPKVKPGEP